jgi:hypothetical protein
VGELGVAAAAAAGFVARWDLDKTYLRTDFDTLGDLVKTALERPDEKRAVPGAATLLREIGHTGARIHILSGSPRQMRSRLARKLELDGARFDELTLKPNLSNLLRLRLFALRDQLGYKLPSLLDARARDQDRGPALREVLLGDDAEADAFVYSLYADLVSGGIDERTLERVLRAGRIYGDQQQACLLAARRIRREPAVERILIHLDRLSPPSRFDHYGPRVVPFYNYLQAAFVLADDGRLGAESVLRVAAELVLRHRFDAEALARSHLDLVRRGRVSGGAARELRSALEGVDPEGSPTLAAVLGRMVDRIEELADRAPRPDPSGQPRLDYVELAERHRGGRSRRRRPR